jgi:rod shape-determining protein MreC
MFKKPQYLFLALVCLIVFILFKLPEGTLAKAKLSISGLFLPLFGLAGSVNKATEKSASAIIPRSELVRQNEVILKENQELKFKLQQAEELARENARLRQMVAWQKVGPWKPVLGRIISRDPANWWRSVQVDRGSRDGVKVNCPVMVAEGLIGRVIAVSEMRCEVLLLGDPNLRVSVIIRETGESGVIIANNTRPLENNMIDLAYLTRNSSVAPGQTVVTSGDGGFFPKGITVGRIVDTRSIDFGLSVEARVKLSAAMNSLEEVGILVP